MNVFRVWEIKNKGFQINSNDIHRKFALFSFGFLNIVSRKIIWFVRSTFLQKCSCFLWEYFQNFKKYNSAFRFIHATRRIFFSNNK